MTRQNSSFPIKFTIMMTDLATNRLDRCLDVLVLVVLTVCLRRSV